MTTEELIAVARQRFDTVRFWAKYKAEADAYFAWLKDLIEGNVKPAVPAPKDEPVTTTRRTSKRRGRR